MRTAEVGRLFFGSSALAKLYHPEIGTPEVDRIIQMDGSQVRISRLSVVELLSVFVIKVRTQFITRHDACLVLRQFQEDILAKKFEVFAVREAEFARAECAFGKAAFAWYIRLGVKESA